MSYQDTFEHILAALYDAMLDDARWPAASALIDEACGITGNDLMVGEGPKDDVQADFVGVYCRAGADCRAGAPASCRSRPGGQNPGADADGDSGGGLVGGRQERARHGRGDRSHEKRHLLAPTADLREAVHLAAGGLDAVGALARRVRVRGSAAGGGLLWPPCRVLGSRAQTNIYLTPPDAQGFAARWDTHDVFVLQVAGRKQWTVYDAKVTLPLKGQAFDPERDAPGPATDQFDLGAGGQVRCPDDTVPGGGPS